ncbi:hypothetical protein BH24CHL2_BH24CHL2_6240 [soil metagenome]
MRNNIAGAIFLRFSSMGVVHVRGPRIAAKGALLSRKHELPTTISVETRALGAFATEGSAQ